MEELTRLLAINGYIPHGYCLTWSPVLVNTFVISDVLTSLSYFSMPLALGYFARKRQDFPYRWLLWLFSAFILACGTTHLMDAIVLWEPMYALDALLKAVTAVISVATAIALWPLLPHALRLPSPSQLQRANIALESEIAQRKQVEQELRESNAKLAALTQDLARSNLELEQFAYVASHDLQEPLRMVVGFVQLLEKRLADKLEGETREFMDFAVDGALRMQRLIQDILAYSRISSRGSELTLVDTGAALQDALNRLASRIEQTGAKIETPDLPKVVADPTQLTQLFQNLIGNAIKFSKKDLPMVKVGAARDGDGWRFTVTDNGIGVAPEYRERIFGIFQRLHTREEYDGTGIGLAICKRIVQRHGGEIGVDSAPNGGSTFWFTIPDKGTHEYR